MRSMGLWLYALSAVLVVLGLYRAWWTRVEERGASADLLHLGGPGIEVTSFRAGKRFRPRAPVTVVIDGVRHRLPFGSAVVAVTPGRHELAVAFGLQQYWARPVVVDVAPGSVTRVRWDMPSFIWQPGTLTVA